MVRPSFSLHSLFLSVHAGPDASVSAPRRERASSQTRAHLGRGTSAHRPAFADKYRGRGGREGVQNSEKICTVLLQITRRLRRSNKRRYANIRRRSGAQHCSSLCSQSEGDEDCGEPIADLSIFATCPWPSLCKQSELQCWRRNKRLCGPAQISAARALAPLCQLDFHGF